MSLPGYTTEARPAVAALLEALLVEHGGDPRQMEAPLAVLKTRLMDRVGGRLLLDVTFDQGYDPPIIRMWETSAGYRSLDIVWSGMVASGE